MDFTKAKIGDQIYFKTGGETGEGTVLEIRGTAYRPTYILGHSREVGTDIYTPWHSRVYDDRKLRCAIVSVENEEIIEVY